MADAEPVALTVSEAGRALAALGMVCKLATEQIPTAPAESAGIVTDAADAIVGIGAQLRTTTGNEALSVGGRTLVYSRTVLLRAIDALSSGR
ncbi:hypothetical protein [Micromonospora sp. NPDC048830]|uniref:hypothetical protein n=1 Tax=Micromonospora sp. NPDC048830 TaxID=3364257 RepID=UPI00371C3BBA